MQATIHHSNDQKTDSNLKVWISDHEIFLNCLRTQDEIAFKSLYKQYSAALYGNILRTVKEDARAKYILECTFVEIWNSISLYDETKIKLFTWLNQIAGKHIKLSE